MTIIEKYNKWLNHPTMDEELKAELLAMNETQKDDAFFKDVEFGTAGMRGKLGAGTNRLNVYTIRKATVGYAKWLLTREDEVKSVAIAYDNRFNSRKFADVSAKVLASFGIVSYVFDELRPTPELSFAVRYLHCTGGIMITASHNPKEDNGYKVYDENGCQLIPTLVAPVVKNVAELGDQFVESPVLTQQQKQLIHYIGEEVDKAYIDTVQTIQINPDLPKDHYKLVYTPQHGTSLKSIRTLYDRMGYDTVYVEEQCAPDPAFSNTVIPNPEDPRAYILALDYARKNDADIVLTTDPDGDRLGIAVRYQGDYKLMTGNQTGSVLIEYVLSQYASKGIMPKNPVLFNTVVTSDLGEAIARNYGVEVEKTLTGFKYIGDKIHHHEMAKDKNFVFGYEESYGYLIKEFVRDKDASQSCLMIAECANYYRLQGKTLLDVLQELFEKYGYYLESQKSITLTGADGSEKLKNLLAKLRANIPTELAGVKIVKYEDYGTQKRHQNGQMEDIVGYDRSDVLKYYMEDGSWIAVRPSGTEPKCKFYYCVKGVSQQDVEQKQQAYYDAIDALIA